MDTPHRDPMEAARTLRRLRSLANSMDSAFRIPGTQIRLGFDSLLGFVPGVGDALTALASSVIIWNAIRMGSRKRTVFKMLGNVGIDLVLGAVPLLGDLFDVAFKSNLRNIALLERELARNSEFLSGSFTTTARDAGTEIARLRGVLPNFLPK